MAVAIRLTDGLAAWLGRHWNMMIDWNVVTQIASVFMALVGGALSVPLINWLKQLAAFDGRTAQIVTFAVSVLIAIATMIVAGQLSPDSVSAEQIGAVLTAVILASQTEYQRLQKRLVSNHNEGNV